MDDALLAYQTGRADGMAARRDHTRAQHPETGADYRMGFLDGRIEVFRLLATVRKIVEDAE
ncbi:hypothetical protein Ade02nite_72040 [Paractinoplanes deccanensis]|uniref:Uncharacterized protein n=1 Tax=Paractinoplanes deccanensis TaxID=113561 RepID=A0ABQ3YEX4_9ACTN|nr:hypothetical protein [Actinoplanes deccanensis]GID78563.1 hypothetical protein Ade02nite_72040 [Actinoplanes deccanensis]